MGHPRLRNRCLPRLRFSATLPQIVKPLVKTIRTCNKPARSSKVIGRRFKPTSPRATRPSCRRTCSNFGKIGNSSAKTVLKPKLTATNCGMTNGNKPSPTAARTRTADSKLAVGNKLAAVHHRHRRPVRLRDHSGSPSQQNGQQTQDDGNGSTDTSNASVANTSGN